MHRKRVEELDTNKVPPLPSCLSQPSHRSNNPAIAPRPGHRQRELTQAGGRQWRARMVHIDPSPSHDEMLRDVASTLRTSCAHRRGLVRRWVARNHHKLEFYKDLFMWMLPWLITAAVATVDGATCFDSYKRTCSYKKKETLHPAPRHHPTPRHPPATLTPSTHPPPTLPPTSTNPQLPLRPLLHRSIHSSSCVSRCYPWPGLYCWGTSSIS